MRVGGPKFLRAVGRNSGGSRQRAHRRHASAAPHRPALPQSAGGARVVPLRGLASRGWRWCSTTSTNSTRGQQTTTCVPGRVSRCRHCEEWECERANAQKRKLGLEALLRDIKHHDDSVSGVRIDDHPFPAPPRDDYTDRRLRPLPVRHRRGGVAPPGSRRSQTHVVRGKMRERRLQTCTVSLSGRRNPRLQDTLSFLCVVLSSVASFCEDAPSFFAVPRT